MDAKTAFLNGDIDKEVCIEIPEGVDIDETDITELGLSSIKDIKNKDLVCKLETSMYGTKKAPRYWNKKIDSVLSEKLKFKRSDGDPCLYVKHNVDGIIIIALYVDDILLAAKTRE